ncbi:MAG: hypothetical protein E7494_14745 [Ruminococcus albus]|nr:hypothetical protein [Ruminococcus albus]
MAQAFRERLAGMFAQSTLLTVGRALNHQGTKPKCTANNKSKTNFRLKGARQKNSERGQINRPRSFCLRKLLLAHRPVKGDLIPQSQNYQQKKPSAVEKALGLKYQSLE